MSDTFLERLKKHVDKVRYIAANGIGEVEWENGKPNLSDQAVEDGVLSSMCVKAVDDVARLIEDHHTIKDALFPEPIPKEITGFKYGLSYDAVLSLASVIAGLSGDKNQTSNIDTLNRVIEQLERARAALASTEGKDKERHSSMSRKLLKEGVLSSNPEVMRGLLCFAGTRIPITSLRSFIVEGYSDEQILKEYPTLTADQVRIAREWTFEGKGTGHEQG